MNGSQHHDTIESLLIQTVVKNKNSKKSKKRAKKRTTEPLKQRLNDMVQYEGGIDEAGRGPMFGRVYSACVILPHNHPTFQYNTIKDSKRFSSKNKLYEVYNHIKEYAIDYCVAYEDETTIDSVNILQATQLSMHKAVRGLRYRPQHLIVDGNYFKPFHDTDGVVPFTCVEGGDDRYFSVAAASILAKVERDLYIEELCDQYPDLDEKYGLLSNKGYGTKRHIDGIKEHGITQWHRRTFGICKQFM